jgi:DNA polymerase III subunit delta
VTAVRQEAARAFLAKSDTIGIVVHGNDEAKIADCMRSLASPAANDPFDVIQLADGDLSGDPGRLLDELQSQSMFGGRTIISIDRAGPGFLKAFELAASIAGARNAFVVNAGNLPKQNALRTKSEASSNVGVIACYEDSPGEIREFVERLIADARMPIEPDALQALAGLVGGSRQAARSEAEKLLLYCHGSESVTLEDVEAVCAASPDSGIDKLVDWMLAGSLAGADREFQSLLDEGESAGRVLNAAAQHVARLQDLHGEIAHGKTADLAVKSARPPIFFKRAPVILKQLRDWSPEQLEQLAASLNAAVFQCRTHAELEPAIASRAVLAATRAARR